MRRNARLVTSGNSLMKSAHKIADVGPLLPPGDDTQPPFRFKINLIAYPTKPTYVIIR